MTRPGRRSIIALAFALTLLAGGCEAMGWRSMTIPPFDKEIAEGIAGASRAELVRLRPPPVPHRVPTLAEFADATPVEILPAGRLKAVRELLLDGDSYMRDLAKRCMFNPEWGLRLSGAVPVDIALAFDCDLLVVAVTNGDTPPTVTGTPVRLDIDPSAARLRCLLRPADPTCDGKE